MKPFSTIAVASVLALSVAGVSSLSAADPIKERQDLLKSYGAAMKAMGGALKSGTTDGVADNAMVIANGSKKLVSLFPAGSESGSGHGHPTRAKPEIWTDRAGFEKANAANGEAAMALAAVAQTGDVAKTGAALKALGATCGGCHKPYRLPKD